MANGDQHRPLGFLDWVSHRYKKALMTARIEFDYLTFYNGKEHLVKATTSFEAQQIAVKHFKPIKSKTHMVHVHLIKEKSNDLQHGSAGYSLQI